MPTVAGWHNPQLTLDRLEKYLKGKDYELWPAIIDYWIGRLYLLRSDAEALQVDEEKRKKETAKAKAAKRGRD